jgi:hypothetical protein
MPRILLSEEEKKRRNKECYDRYRRENPDKFKASVLKSTVEYNKKHKEAIREKYLGRYAQKKENEKFLKILLE